jgi:hypothetical protein
MRLSMRLSVRLSVRLLLSSGSPSFDYGKTLYATRKMKMCACVSKRESDYAIHQATGRKCNARIQFSFVCASIQHPRISTRFASR